MSKPISLNRPVARRQMQHLENPGLGPQILRLGMALALSLGTTVFAQSYRVLRHFTYDGSNPQGLILGGSEFYGIAGGGALNLNYGVVFKMNTNGSGYTVLKNFTGSDGAFPSGSLVLSGNTLYGVASGRGYCTWIVGQLYCFGVVFKVNTDGSGFAVLKSFTGSDGMNPVGGMVLSGSTLYGTTQLGGSVFNLPNNYGQGVVFKVNTDGSGYTVLKNFAGSLDGTAPSSVLILSGNTLYGTAANGGTLGLGLVFRMNTDGSGYTVLKTFTGYDGGSPQGDLILSGSTLYGTAGTGGATWLTAPNDGGGVVFRLNTDGSGYEVLRSFTPGEGFAPMARLVLAGSTLYGSTQLGGIGYYRPGLQWGYGMVFKVNTDGSDYAVLKSFEGGNDGCNPSGTMVLAGNTLYGTTEGGGSLTRGVVFRGVLLSITKAPVSQTAEAGSTVTIQAEATSFAPGLTCQWLFNGTNALIGATNASLELANVQPVQAGSYTLLASNLAEGSVTSAPVMLSVIPHLDRRMVPAVNLSGDPGTLLHLERSESLNAPQWSSLADVPLPSGSGSQAWFDLASPMSSQRFYRAWASGGPPPVLDATIATEIQLTGVIGNSARIDYINAIGPTDAWVALGSVTFTNATQPYFDLTSFRQPDRLYRVVPVP